MNKFERISPTRAVIHGDAHTGNLLRDPSGRIMLGDLDSTGIGPVAWDLVVCAVVAQRFGRTGFYREFSAACGWDVTQTSEWPTLRRIRELILVTSALPDLGRRPEVAAEHQHRLRTLREETLNARWHPYR
ncbi:phosphotransferase family protein [Nocardia sp. NPDC059764]|uniref:phosphotransferase family protein n=1 Tax=Nocardia sp. NPDC059764 TaxID=3346939 RepID=UPI003660FA11